MSQIPSISVPAYKGPPPVELPTPPPPTNCTTCNQAIVKAFKCNKCNHQLWCSYQCFNQSSWLHWEPCRNVYDPVRTLWNCKYERCPIKPVTNRDIHIPRGKSESDSWQCPRCRTKNGDTKPAPDHHMQACNKLFNREPLIAKLHETLAGASSGTGLFKELVSIVLMYCGDADMWVDFHPTRQSLDEGWAFGHIDMIEFGYLVKALPSTVGYEWDGASKADTTTAEQDRKSQSHLQRVSYTGRGEWLPNPGFVPPSERAPLVAYRVHFDECKRYNCTVMSRQTNPRLRYENLSINHKSCPGSVLDADISHLPAKKPAEQIKEEEDKARDELEAVGEDSPSNKRKKKGFFAKVADLFTTTSSSAAKKKPRPEPEPTRYARGLEGYDPHIRHAGCWYIVTPDGDDGYNQIEIAEFSTAHLVPIPQAPGCFESGSVMLETGEWCDVWSLRKGDRVRAPQLDALHSQPITKADRVPYTVQTIAQIQYSSPMEEYRMLDFAAGAAAAAAGSSGSGGRLSLTSGHPVFVPTATKTGGADSKESLRYEWMRPDEIDRSGIDRRIVYRLCNFVLSSGGGSDLPASHTLLARATPPTAAAAAAGAEVPDFVVCSTIGSDCGERLAAAYPELHAKYGPSQR